MRKSLLVTFAFALLLSACSKSTNSASGGSPSANPSASVDCSPSALTLVTPGKLTVGTDVPAYQPWFAGTGKDGPWNGVPDNGTGNPYSGQGYESAVAYAIAQKLGFTKDQVTWVPVNFNESYKPGPKNFDFDINEVSVTPERATAVTFSDGYFDDNQALVVNKGTPIAKVTSIAGLKPYSLGAQLGTTSYQFIKDTIQPSKQPSVFPSNAGAVQALKNKQIDGLVVDLPTAFYVTAVQVPNSKVLGQFEAEPGGEHFGMVFAKGNSLVRCVNGALTKLRDDGTLKQLQQKWLAKATGAPTLK